MDQGKIIAIHCSNDFSGVVSGQNEYRGKPLGKLSQLHHGVSGEVYAVDARTIHIRNFSYDGEGPGKILNVACFS